MTDLRNNRSGREPEGRNSTMEALRILCMLMILAIHYMNRAMGGALRTSLWRNLLISHTVMSACIPAVNVFVLIGAYYLQGKRTTRLARAIELYLLLILYNAAGMVLVLALGEKEFTWELLLRSLVPFGNGKNWFVEAYALLLLALPFLSLLTDRLTKQAHLLLLGLLFLVFSVWPSYLPGAQLTEHGYSVVQFVNLYFLAGWLRRYAVFRRPKRWIRASAAAYLVCVALTTLSSFSESLEELAWEYFYPPVLLASAALFLLFLNLPKTDCRAVDRISGVTYDIFLIHTTVCLRSLIYKKIMHSRDHIDDPNMVFHFLLCIVLEFAVCAAIGLLRQRLWRPTVGKWLRGSRLLQKERAWEERSFPQEP